jgi:hypothetical protein
VSKALRWNSFRDSSLVKSGKKNGKPMSSLGNMILIFTLFLFNQQCGKEHISKRIPACIEAKIKEISESRVWNPPAKVYSYTYQGERVYYIPRVVAIFPANSTMPTATSSAASMAVLPAKATTYARIFSPNVRTKNFYGKTSANRDVRTHRLRVRTQILV